MKLIRVPAEEKKDGHNYVLRITFEESDAQKIGNGERSRRFLGQSKPLLSDLIQQISTDMLKHFSIEFKEDIESEIEFEKTSSISSSSVFSGESSDVTLSDSVFSSSTLEIPQEATIFLFKIPRGIRGEKIDALKAYFNNLKLGDISAFNEVVESATENEDKLESLANRVADPSSKENGADNKTLLMRALKKQAVSYPNPMGLLGSYIMLDNKLGLEELIKGVPELIVEIRNKADYFLFLAINNQSMGVVQYFVGQLKMDVNIRDENGNTPLHLVAQKRNILLLKYLLSIKNIQRSKKNNKDQTPYQFAIALRDKARREEEEKEYDDDDFASEMKANIPFELDEIVSLLHPPLVPITKTPEPERMGITQTVKGLLTDEMNLATRLNFSHVTQFETETVESKSQAIEKDFDDLYEKTKDYLGLNRNKALPEAKEYDQSILLLYGLTPLLAAAKYNQFDKLNNLLILVDNESEIYGEDLHSDEDGRNILMLAAENGHIPAFDLILARAQQLSQATQEECLEKYLKKSDVDGNNIYMIAAKAGQFDMVQYIYQKMKKFDLITDSQEALLIETIENLKTSCKQNLKLYDQYARILAFLKSNKTSRAGKKTLLQDAEKNFSAYEKERQRLVEAQLSMGEHFAGYHIGNNSHNKKTLSLEDEAVGLYRQFGKDTEKDAGKYELEVKFSLSDQERWQLYGKYTALHSLLQKERLIPRKHTTDIEGYVIDILSNKEAKESACLKLLACICSVMEKQMSSSLQPFKFTPIQLFNLLALLNSPHRLAQIKPGEGKSYLFAILAAFDALTGRSVDIVTSVRHLFLRDLEKFNGFFSELGIPLMRMNDMAQYLKKTNGTATGATLKKTVINKDNLKMQYKNINCKPVSYGSIEDFEISYLLECIVGIPPGQSKHQFDTLILDEADDIAIDSPLQGSRMMNAATEISSTEDAEHIQYSEICGAVWSYINQSNINKSYADLKKYVNVHLTNFSKQHQITPTLLSDNDAKRWFGSASRAQKRIFNQDYFIHEGKVVIVKYDKNGQKQPGLLWERYEQNLIEYKHGLKITPKGQLIGAITHLDFIRKYKSIRGGSGTLGSKQDRAWLHAALKTDTYDSPRWRASQITQGQNICVETHAQKNQKVLDFICQKASTGAAIMIFCENIKESQNMVNLIQANFRGYTINLYNDKNKQDVSKMARDGAKPHTINIGTIAVCRGLDMVQLSNQRVEVLTTFLPHTTRAKEQTESRPRGQGSCSTLIERSQLLDYFSSKGMLDEKFKAMTTPQLFTKWEELRDELSTNYQDLALSKRVKRFEAIALDVFAHVPSVRMKALIFDEWAKTCEQVNNIIRDIGYEANNVVALAESKVCEALIGFWDNVVKLTQHPSPSILHFAVATCQYELIQLLKRHDKQYRLLVKKDKDGKTPLEIAQEMGVYGIAQIEILTHKPSVSKGVKSAKLFSNTTASVATPSSSKSSMLASYP